MLLHQRIQFQRQQFAVQPDVELRRSAEVADAAAPLQPLHHLERQPADHLPRPGRVEHRVPHADQPATGGAPQPVLLLHQNHPGAKPGGADRREYAGATAADHADIRLRRDLHLLRRNQDRFHLMTFLSFGSAVIIPETRWKR